MEAAGHEPSLLRSSHVLRAVPQGGITGTGGQRGCYLLEVDEPLVGAESRCQSRDPGTADGIALETDTKRGALGRAALGTAGWAAGLHQGLKAPLTPRKRSPRGAEAKGAKVEEAEGAQQGALWQQGVAARGCCVLGTYSRLCRLWLTFRASAKATEPLSPTELLESLRQEAEGALPAAVSQPEPLMAVWGPQPPALQRD